MNRIIICLAVLTAALLSNCKIVSAVETTDGDLSGSIFVSFGGPHLLPEGGSIEISASLWTSLDLSNYQYQWFFAESGHEWVAVTDTPAIEVTWHDLTANGFALEGDIFFSMSPFAADAPMTLVSNQIAYITVIPESSALTLGVGLLVGCVMLLRRLSIRANFAGRVEG